MRDLVAYARARGVKIVPEFDEPAHVGFGWEWGPSAGLGNLVVCLNEDPWYDLCLQPPCGQLNIVNDNVYVMLGMQISKFHDIKFSNFITQDKHQSIDR